MNVFLIAAISADGFIARDAHQPANWTSKEDKKVFVELTKRARVMIMGRNTFETIGRALPGRRNIVYSSKPIDVEGIEVTNEKPTTLLEKLENEGYQEVAICGGQKIYDLFLAEGLVNTLYLTLEPKLFGNGLSIAKTSVDVDLHLKDVSKLNDDTLLLEYEVQNGSNPS
nr:Dihydrofolate reductase [uncultured bacterium]